MSYDPDYSAAVIEATDYLRSTGTTQAQLDEMRDQELRINEALAASREGRPVELHAHDRQWMTYLVERYGHDTPEMTDADLCERYVWATWDAAEEYV